jgi:hypothetical protein
MLLRRRDAICLVIASPLAVRAVAARAQGAELPQRWKATDDPPSVEGIRLGDSRERVLAVLGSPDPSPFPDDPSADLRTMRYRGGALMVAIDRNNAVTRILLSRPEGGALAGFRVGDRLGALLTSWGEPTTSTSTVGRYDTATWRITVKADLASNQVLRLMLGRLPPPPPATPAAAPQAGSPPGP